MGYELLSKLFYKDPMNYEKIYQQRYHSELTIKLPLKIHENQAFFTNPMEISNTLTKIWKKHHATSKMIHNLPEVAITSFINKSLKDEIVLTNDIEGVYSTRKEIEHTILNKNKKSRFKGFVKAYIKLIQNHKISLRTCEDIRKIYDDIVFDEIDVKDRPDGRIFRKGSVHVVSPTQKEKHRGVMPEEKIITYMNECLNFMNEDNIPTLIQVAVFHYLFGYIHPFYDGNGRMSRFISSCILKDELGILVSLRLSYVIKNNINVYYRAFDICNDIKNKGEITYFILMFLDLLKEATIDLYDKINDLSRKLLYYKDKIETLDMKPMKAMLLDILCQNRLFDDTFISIDGFVDITGKSQTTIRNVLKELENEGYILKARYGKEIRYTANLSKIELMEKRR